jgi:hypothetical protein
MKVDSLRAIDVLISTIRKPYSPYRLIRGAEMKVWVSTAMALLAVLPSAAGYGRCRPARAHHCFAVPAILDLTSVPDISQRIVAREPAAPQARPQGSLTQPATPYTGPTVGVSRLGRAPTVGYHWSLN